MVYVQRCVVVTWLVPRQTAAVSERSVYTKQSCTMSRHFMQSHIRTVHACLAVTCHLHLWQNDRDLLRATAVTQGWNGYQNKRMNVNSGEETSHRSFRDSNPRPFNHESGAHRSFALLLSSPSLFHFISVFCS